MATYAEHFYGLNLTEAFREIDEAIRERFDEAEDEGWGDSVYDGNGLPITFIGVRVPQSPKGFVVTSEVEAAAMVAYESCPEDVRIAVAAALGTTELPEPSFHVMTGWG